MLCGWTTAVLPGRTQPGIWFLRIQNKLILFRVNAFDYVWHKLLMDYDHKYSYPLCRGRAFLTACKEKEAVGRQRCLFCVTSWSGRIFRSDGSKNRHTTHSQMARAYSRCIWWCRISNSEGQAGRWPCRWSSPAEIKSRVKRGCGQKKRDTVRGKRCSIRVEKVYKIQTRKSFNLGGLNVENLKIVLQ